MALTNLTSPAVFASFFKPLSGALATASNTFLCKALPDESWLELGVRRCLSLVQSGRDFLQSMAGPRDTDLHRSTFFESLKSARRHSLCLEVNQSLLKAMSGCVEDPFSKVDATRSLEDFDLYAGDGHFHEAACHDEAVASAGTGQPVKYAAGHLYALNLRTQGLSHLTVLDQVERLKEHDMRALKRLVADTLRQGAPPGRKVLYVWDRAGIDFRQWHHWKSRNGIYFLSREKENMALEVCGIHHWDRDAACNQGVLADEIVATSTGVSVRRVTYYDAERGETFRFLTNLPASVPPGLVALLYRRRWDLEKVFDEIKNKMGETKAWGSSPEAKSNQAALICVTHNLLTLFACELAEKEGIANVAEHKRKQKRFEKRKALLEAAGKTLPPVLAAFQRCTVHSVKFVRWLRHHLDSPAPWRQSCEHLARVYVV